MTSKKTSENTVHLTPDSWHHLLLPGMRTASSQWSGWNGVVRARERERAGDSRVYATHAAFLAHRPRKVFFIYTHGFGTEPPNKYMAVR